jgi:hypothetical protein
VASRGYSDRLLEDQGYFNVRILPDGLVCNFNMLFTRALVIDPDFGGTPGGRVCYEDRALAVEACNAMTSIYDEPLPGYTADKRMGKVMRKANPPSSPG